MNHSNLLAAVHNIIELNERLTAMTKQRDGIEAKLRIELRGHPDSEIWGGAGLIAATMRCVDAVDEAIEQRDRLAMALQELCEALLTGNPRNITELINKAGDALQFTTNPNEL